MFLAFMMAAVAMPDWVPARWPSNDPATLELVSGSAVNCLLIDQKLWSGPFSAKAEAQGIHVIGVVRPDADVKQSISTAKELKLHGIVLEGDFGGQAEAARLAVGNAAMPVVELTARRNIRFDHGSNAILGTHQGLWPGIRPVDEKDKAHAMPSGGPWIDTNNGFLRYARAMHGGPFWMAYAPPSGQAIPIDRYLQAVADSAMQGARWVVTLDGDFSKRLLARDAAAVKDWNRILAHVKFYEDQKEARSMQPYGQLALVQDAASGALLSGNVLDMISVKHTPVRPVPAARLSADSLAKAEMAVNVDPSGLTPEQRDALTKFQRSGGTVLNGPAGWKMPADSKNHLTVDEDVVEKLDQIWKEMNTLINRRNMGVRLFNVSSMLSYMQAAPNGRRAVLHLVNYSGYPVENVTAHVLGKFKTAWLSTPEGARKKIEPYEIEEGAGVGLDIDVVPVCAVIWLEM